MQKRHEVEGGRDSKCILIRRKSGVRSRAMQGRRFETNVPKISILEDFLTGELLYGPDVEGEIFYQ